MKKIATKLGLVLSAVVIAALALCVAGCGSKTVSYTTTLDGQEYTFDIIKEGKLTCAMSPDYPPFEELVGDDLNGAEVEIGQAIAELLGLEYDWVNMDFDGIITAIQSGGQADLGTSGFSVTPEREELIDFAASYYTDDMAVAVLKDNGTITAGNALQALNSSSVKIAVQQGTTGEAWAQENFPEAELVPFKNANDCFAACQAGKTDAVCNNRSVVAANISASYEGMAVVLSVATDEPYAFVVSEDNHGLLDAVNAALEHLTADGTINDILVKYGLR